jgi:hypothetical protein
VLDHVRMALRADFSTVEADGDPVAVTLSDASGPVALPAGTEVTLLLRDATTGASVAPVSCTVTDAGDEETAGRISFVTSNIPTGIYYAQYRVLFAPSSPDEREVFFPRGDRGRPYDVIEITGNLL